MGGVKGGGPLGKEDLASLKEKEMELDAIKVAASGWGGLGMVVAFGSF